MDVIRRLQYCNPCNSVGTTFSTHSHMLTHWNVHATHQEEPIIKCMINIFIRLCIHPLKPSCHLFSMQHWSGTVSLWWTPTVLAEKGSQGCTLTFFLTQAPLCLRRWTQSLFGLQQNQTVLHFASFSHGGIKTVEGLEPKEKLYCDGVPYYPVISTLYSLNSSSRSIFPLVLGCQCSMYFL